MKDSRQSGQTLRRLLQVCAVVHDIICAGAVLDPALKVLAAAQQSSHVLLALQYRLQASQAHSVTIRLLPLDYWD